MKIFALILVLFTFNTQAYDFLGIDYWEKSSHHLQHLQNAFNNGSNIKGAKNTNNRTVLNYAVMYAKSPEVITFLVNTVGMDVNARDLHFSTPLHNAAHYNRHPEIISTLLKLGALVNARDSEGDTPLHKAASYSNLADLQILIKAGAEIDAKNRHAMTPLHEAVFYNNTNLDIVKELIKAGANINEINRLGKNVIEAAKDNKNPAIYQYLKQIAKE